MCRRAWLLWLFVLALPITSAWADETVFAFVHPVKSVELIASAAEVKAGTAERRGQISHIVSIKVPKSFARQFGHFTQEIVGQSMDLVVGCDVVQSSVVREPILGGSLELSGEFTEAQAASLAATLQKGGPKCKAD